MYSLLKTSAKVLLVFLSLTSEIIYAQNYKAVKTDASYYFYDSTSMEIIAERIDSIALVGNETHYYAMRQIRYTDYSCFIPNGASWMGDVVIEKPGGIFQFVLYPFSPSDSADVFTIKSNALVGESWHFYNYHSANHYIEATVNQVVIANFIGISDSVKTITLQRKDASGQNLSDPVNGQKLLLSKNYGLIRIPKFDEFNTNQKFIDLCGKTNPVMGRVNLSFEEIFDFQPGDEFHVSYEDEPYGSFFPREMGAIIQRILERHNGSNTDTVSYTVAECKTIAYVQGMDQINIVNTTDTILIKYIKSQNPDFTFEPHEPQISSYPEMLELTTNEIGLSATNALENSGIPWKLTNATWPLWLDGSGQCWLFATIDDYQKSTYYYKGLGGPYHYWMSSWSNTNYRTLAYYKKGSETWGQPFNCETLLHVGLPENHKIQETSIYPNPTLGIITVSCPTNWEFPCRLEIFDLSGRTAVEYKVNYQKQTFDLSGLPTGLYSFKLTSADSDVFRGKFIRQ